MTTISTTTGSCLAAQRAMDDGDISAASDALADAAAARPENPVVHYLLALMRAREGLLDQAVGHARQALAIDPNLSPVHALLARHLRESGAFLAALRHEQEARRGAAAVTAPFYGEGEPLRVLQLGAVPVSGLTGTDGFLDAAHTETTTLIVQHWDLQMPLPEHDLIWNAIADEEVHAPALDVADWLIAHSDAPVINAPDRVRGTDRLRNAERFANLEGVCYPRMEAFNRDALPTLRFPLLVRSRGEHNGRNFAYVPDAAALRAVVGELPGEELLAIEYVETRGNDARYRKYRAMIVDGALYPAHLAISSHWNVHYFSAQMGDEERCEERAFLADMQRALPPEVFDALKRVAHALALDYAGIDFGITTDGRLAVFEANAVMTVFVPPPTARDMYRREAALRIFDAAREMMRRRM